jgi:hypothetical protein
MNVAKITRRSRKFGWGVNAGATQGEHSLYVEAPDSPDIEGTVKQVFNYIETDNFYRSLKSGGTYYTTAFFIDGKKINTQSEAWQYEFDRLLDGEIDELELPLQ